MHVIIIEHPDDTFYLNIGGVVIPISATRADDIFKRAGVATRREQHEDGTTEYHYA